MTDWTELPAGRDIPIKQGFLYAALLHLKNNHSLDDIRTFAQARSFRVDDLRNLGSDGGNYSKVAIMGLATADSGWVPWNSPVPLFDESGVKRAWAMPATGVEKPLPPGPLTSTSTNTGIVVASLAAAAGVGYLLWRRYGKRR